MAAYRAGPAASPWRQVWPVLVLLAGLLAVAASRMPAPSVQPPGEVPAVREVPAATAAFLAAFRRGDELAAENVASPLYRLEQERRQRSARDLASRGFDPAASDARLDFTFVAGAVDGGGYEHLLFVVRPARADPADLPSVWRVDADASGRVIWLELVWLFGTPDVTFLRPGTSVDRLAWPLPPVLRGMRQDVVLGVRATSGPEGYFVVRAPAASPDTASATRLRFLGTDADGQVRPGAWSYGRTDASAAPYGEVLGRTVEPAIDPALAALRRAYVDAL